MIQRETPTEHGLEFDQAADKVIKIDDLILSVSGNKDLVESIVEFKACKESEQDGLSENIMVTLYNKVQLVNTT